MSLASEMGIIPIGRKSRKSFQSDNIKQLSNEYELNDEQLNLLRSSNLYSYGDLSRYVNELLTAQYQTEDEREYKKSVLDEQRSYDESSPDRMRAHGLNPDLLGLPESSSPMDVSGSIYPDANSLQKVLSGSGTLSESFSGVLGNVLKLATFGVSSYATISNSLMEQGLKIAGLAASDVESFTRNDKGFVTNVDSAISEAVRARGFRPGSRKASIYASELGRRINSLPAVLKSVQTQDAYNNALSSSKVSAYKASDEYTSMIIDGLRLAEQTKNKLSEIDFQNAKDKAQFLKDHPDYNSQLLEDALTKSGAESRKAVADADKAESDAALSELEKEGARLDNQSKRTQQAINEENLKQEQARTEVDQSDKDLKILKNKITTRTIEGFDAMIQFCRDYEEMSYNAGRKHSPEWSAWHAAHEEDTRRYVEYKRILKREGYWKKPVKLRGGINAGPASFSVGN